jgi:hypothetical protein
VHIEREYNREKDKICIGIEEKQSLKEDTRKPFLSPLYRL